MLGCPSCAAWRGNPIRALAWHLKVEWNRREVGTVNYAWQLTWSRLFSALSVSHPFGPSKTCGEAGFTTRSSRRLARIQIDRSLFQLALCSSIDASDGGLSMRNSLYSSELARPARPALDARAFCPRLTQFNYFKLHLRLQKVGRICGTLRYKTCLCEQICQVSVKSATQFVNHCSRFVVVS